MARWEPRGSKAETECFIWGLENSRGLPVLWSLTGPQLGCTTGLASAWILVIYSSRDWEHWDGDWENDWAWWAGTSKVSVMVGR